MSKVEWKKLGEICTIRNGYTPSTKISENWEGGNIPWFTLEDIRKNGRFLNDSIKHITPLGVKKGVLFPKDSIIISTTATIGEYAIVYKDFICNQQISCLSVADKKLITPKYLLYYAYFIGRWCMKNVNGGGSLLIVSTSKLQRIPIPVPSLNVQERIVNILDTFTSSIENLKEQIALRRKQYEYYRDQLLDLEGKEGVEMKTLGSFGDVTKLAGFEFTEHVTYKEDGKIIALRGLNVKNGHLDLSQVKYIDGSNFGKLERSKLVTNDMLFTYVGTIGNVALVNEDDKYYLAPNVSRIRFDQDVINPKFALYVFMSEKFYRTQINKFLNSSSMKNLSMENIRKFVLPIPSLSEQQRIVGILDVFEESIQNLEAQLSQREKQYEYYRNKLLTFE